MATGPMYSPPHPRLRSARVWLVTKVSAALVPAFALCLAEAGLPPISHCRRHTPTHIAPNAQDVTATSRDTRASTLTDVQL